jgi:hypothetical protein
MGRAAAFAALAGVALATSPVAAQQNARIAPDEARQCAIWASYVSAEIVDDPDTQQALMFATNYFVGHYEGATGRSIAGGDDRAAAEQLVLNLEQVTQMCSAHMEAYGLRMTAWGAALEALGQNEQGK